MMIEIINKEQCCGCGACVNVCPKSCIKMEYDYEGFIYPVTDSEKCISCDVCNKVCHMDKEINGNEKSQTEYYAAYNKDIEIAKDSSSGGVFWEIVKYLVEYKNAVVYGAVLKSDFYICHERAETLLECEGFRKSKYLQSNVEFAYKQAKNDLLRGRTVLFSGTPCQIAGLYGFLGKHYNELYTVEVICHGVPSKRIFDMFIDSLNKKYEAKVISMCWRDKRNGWGPNHISIKFNDGSEILTTSENNPYQNGFLHNLYLRPSCYECQYAKLPRIADISLADFWNYDGDLIKTNQNSGLSAIIISTKNGQKLFTKISRQLVCHPVTEEYLKARSRHVWIHPEYNSKRKVIYKNLDKKNFAQLEKQIYGPFYIKLLKKIKHGLKK